MDLKINHGTRAAYTKNGCRCKKCTQANSAYRYARRLADRWDDPIGSRFVVAEGASIDGGKIVVPACVLKQAIDNLAEEIKKEALSVFWHLRRLKGKPN